MNLRKRLAIGTLVLGLGTYSTSGYIERRLNDEMSSYDRSSIEYQEDVNSRDLARSVKHASLLGTVILMGALAFIKRD